MPRPRSATSRGTVARRTQCPGQPSISDTLSMWVPSGCHSVSPWARYSPKRAAMAPPVEECVMKVAIPREVKNHEYRVAITPAGVHELVRNGHEVFVEAGAGTGSAIVDQEYREAGAVILPTADDVWAEGYLVLKVKEPI